MKKITPCLWFNNEAEEAANFYISIFPNSKINEIQRYTTDTPSHKPIGSVLMVNFSLDDNEFSALNGGPEFRFSEAVSFVIPCENQEEIDKFYEKLSAEPNSEICGWLKDRYGISWQLVPKQLEELMKYADEEKKKRTMEALLKMRRINIEALINA